MKPWQTNRSTPCYAEITYEAIRLRYKGQNLALSLARLVDGRLEPSSKESVAHAFRKFIHKSALQPRVNVVCAVNARGLSLRCLQIPRAGRDENKRLIELQVESEFPLSPSELAWGSVNLNGDSSAALGQERVLIAAVRRQVLEDYLDIFSAAGSAPVFVPAALARVLTLPQCTGRVAHLEVGAKYSELIQLHDGIPAHLKTIAWGTRDLVSNVHSDSATLCSTPSPVQVIAAPLRAGAVSLASLIRNGAVLEKIYLSGIGAEGVELARALGEELGTSCELLHPRSGQDGSTALAGLETASETSHALPRLSVERDLKRDARGKSRPIPRKWAAAAVALVLLAALFPYLEALAFKPGLARKLAALKSDRGRLAEIDSQLEFLRFLKQSQPPYLDALYMISRALPPGSRFDSVSMSRRGELSLRGSMRDATQVAEFRSKLLDSGLFSIVAIEEQTPTRDRQKLDIRITASWKPDQTMRETGSQLAAKEPARPKSAFPAMPGMMPPGLQSFPSPVAGPGGPGGPIVLPPGAMPARGVVMPGGPPGIVMPAGAVAPVPGVPPSDSSPPDQPRIIINH